MDTLIKNRAFKYFLANMPDQQARWHLSECLSLGGEMAFELLDEVLGEGWRYEHISRERKEGILCMAVKFAREQVNADMAYTKQ